ncbi:hypothetical protein ACFL0H_13225 [Thermodesulfobacteriota bacterium]
MSLSRRRRHIEHQQDRLGISEMGLNRFICPYTNHHRKITRVRIDNEKLRPEIVRLFILYARSGVKPRFI